MIEKNYQKINVDKVSIKRVNNIVYISFNNGFDTRLLDVSSMLSNPFDIPVTFGSSIDANGNPFRYFTGTLSNMNIKLSQTSKIIKYNSNNGSGKINQQIVVGSKTAKLIENTYIKEEWDAETGQEKTKQLADAVESANKKVDEFNEKLDFKDRVQGIVDYYYELEKGEY